MPNITQPYGQDNPATHDEVMDVIRGVSALATLSYEEVIAIYLRGRGLLNDGAASLGAEIPRDWTPAPKVIPAGKGILDEIAAERRRQDEQWGGASHDDEHDDGALAVAGAVYALDSVPVHNRDPGHVLAREVLRPTSPCGHGQTDQRRSLIKAAAMIVAEIERLDRLDAARARDQTSV